jgi:hypothetical protein
MERFIRVRFMADIFISYRRKDSGWATTWIADQLAQQYDVFFDRDDIDYGDQFPAAISRALKECRVFLAIIGPEWDSADNLKRLQEDKDWVRQEIQTALDRKGVRTVPVLLDREKLPLEDAVPEKLRSLLLSEAMPFSNKKRDSDLELLKKKLDMWLAGGAYQASARRTLPPVVPQLCNRVVQEEKLIELFTDNREITKTPVIILHGHRWEEHLGFIDRLRHRHLMVEVLGLHGQDVGMSVTALQWNVDRAAEGQYDKVLRAAVKRHVLQSPVARDEEVSIYFRTIPQPQVLLIQVTWSDYRKCGERLIEGLIAAWRKLFEETDDRGSMVRLEPPFPVILWINISYEDMVQEISFEKLLDERVQKFVSVLPKLPPVMEGDIQAWVGMEEVRRFVHGHEGHVLALIEKPDLCCGEGKMHMRCFVEKAREILAG